MAPNEPYLHVYGTPRLQNLIILRIRNVPKLFPIKFTSKHCNRTINCIQQINEVVGSLSRPNFDYLRLPSFGARRHFVHLIVIDSDRTILNQEFNQIDTQKWLTEVPPAVQLINPQPYSYYGLF